MRNDTARDEIYRRAWGSASRRAEECYAEARAYLELSHMLPHMREHYLRLAVVRQEDGAACARGYRAALWLLLHAA